MSLLPDTEMSYIPDAEMPYTPATKMSYAQVVAMRSCEWVESARVSPPAPKRVKRDHRHFDDVLKRWPDVFDTAYHPQWYCSSSNCGDSRAEPGLNYCNGCLSKLICPWSLIMARDITVEGKRRFDAFSKVELPQ